MESSHASSQALNAVRAPSTTMPVRRSYDARLSPRAKASPKVLFRECWEVQVATRSPMPARPMQVMASPPRAEEIRPISARPRVMSAARVLSPKPRPTHMPHAMAMTFFTAAQTSTPVRSFV